MFTLCYVLAAASARIHHHRALQQVEALESDLHSLERVAKPSLPHHLTKGPSQNRGDHDLPRHTDVDAGKNGDVIFRSMSNMQVCLDAQRTAGATLQAGNAFIANFASQLSTRAHVLMKAGVGLHRSFLWNLQQLELALHAVTWTVGALTTSTHFQMFHRAVDIMDQFVSYKALARTSEVRCRPHVARASTRVLPSGSHPPVLPGRPCDAVALPQ